ncbi:MAG: transcriptional regulator [Deltaproteobacteria bacterium]|jgi:hypothetical protein|nr:transcriptional regulator [Deltaproteobacteria bacterium]
MSDNSAPNNFAAKSYPSLTAVCHQMVLRAPSKLSGRIIAELAGYTNYNTCMSEVSAQAGHKLGVDKLLALMDACGSDAPVEFLARERGGVFIRIPEAAEGSGELAKTLASSVHEFSEFMQETAASISDGQIPKDQLERITKEGQDAIEAICAMTKLARVTHERQYGGLKQ